ncbi:MAG: adenylate/guanylate cyclase domain-containing protein, partial [Spirochaetales bacterium]|nr:adenylate/guanylate cyclase domain-containing protein [Spirochaetales bacterium]
MGAKGFFPITAKVNLIIIVSLVLGIGSTTFYFARSLFLTIDNSTTGNLDQQSRILYNAIENFMLPGQAPLAVNFFSGVESTNPDYRIMLYRRDGAPAFSDNATIAEVNERLGRERFRPRTEPALQYDPPVLNYFSLAAANPPETAVFRTVELEKHYFNVYKPLINLPKCTACHGADHTIRGVIGIRNDITDAIRSQRSSMVISGSLFLGLVIVLAVVLAIFLKRTVLQPIQV